MLRPPLRYLVLWLFLFGIIIIVFLQVLSGYNIRRLAQGNKSLLDELQVQTGLRKLEADMLTVESDIRGAVITKNEGHLKNIEGKIRAIENEMQELHKRFLKKEPAEEINLLQFLVQEKINHSHNILTAFYTRGKDAAEEVVNTNRGKEIRDSLVAVMTQLETNRQAQLRTIVGSIETTGRRARVWGFVITTIALIAVIMAFWYITNQGRQQQKMILALNESEKKARTWRI
jgi:CHASE3 domain sensor protein